MADLHLANVPEDLIHQIERLAQLEGQTPAETIVHLLEEAVPRALGGDRHPVREILDRIRRDPIVPGTGTPDSVELLREDRNR